jgi:hypothetical protein
MLEQQSGQHVMNLEIIHESGAEEWFCPNCGRRFLMQWPPQYRKIVLQEGDPHASHSGGKGGLEIQSLQVNHESTQIDEDPNLKPWIDWMEQVDLERLWGD